MDEPFVKDDEKTFCSRALNLGLVATILLNISFGIYSGVYLDSYLTLIFISSLYFISTVFTLNSFINKLYKNVKEITLLNKLFTLAVTIGLFSFIQIVFLFFKKEFVITILVFNCVMDITLMFLKDKIEFVNDDTLKSILKKIVLSLLFVMSVLLFYSFVFGNIPLLLFIFTTIISICLSQLWLLSGITKLILIL